MLTLRASATLLGAATSIDAATRIAHDVGFDGMATRLHVEVRDALKIPPEVVDATIVQGQGSLRALAMAVQPGTPLRELFSRLASRLAAKTPHVLWVFFAVEQDGDAIAIGAPVADRRPPRVSALIVTRSHVMDSDADTLRMLAAARSTDDLTTHARFVEILGRDALSRRFFRTLELCIRRLADSARGGADADRHEVALLYASRLLFLGFLEAKGWLDGDASFLVRVFDECMTTGGGFHSRVLLPLFFGTLNTPVAQRAARARAFGRVPFLNGGLFTRTAVERQLKSVRFDDEALGQFFGDLFSRYRFTAREETSSFEEAAIDPEMMGRTFECLMAARTRRTSGVFYTPHELVDRVSACGLEELLKGSMSADTADRLIRGQHVHGDEAKAARQTLSAIRVLDPACGSGAFLVHTLDRLAALMSLSGDARSTEAIRRQVLTTSIFGVDINPTAVWLCQLRLWLSIVIDTVDVGYGSLPPLPNLDRNIRVGDSLAGVAFDEATDGRSGGTALRVLRTRYTRATGRRKANLARLLDREERRLVLETTAAELASVTAARRDLVAARRGRDLFGGRYVPSREEVRQAAALRERSVELRRRATGVKKGAALPFSFPAHFADVAGAGGFSLVVGNPPWVRPHNQDVEDRESFRRQYVVARAAQWTAGAEAAGAGRGFAAQVDLAALFVERSLRLLAPGGTVSLLLPAKLWRSLSGGGFRRLVTSEATLARVEDYSDQPTEFDAAVYPGLLVGTRPGLIARETPNSATVTRVAVLHRCRMATTWTAPTTALAWDASIGSPWILIPPDVRDAFEELRNAGTPFAASRFGRPLLGVKCGFNDAFVVTTQDRGDVITRVASANGRVGDIETDVLRPVVRGERVKPWQIPTNGEAIAWTVGARGEVLTTLPPGLLRWLAPHRRALLARADARPGARWWSLFRTEGARSDTPRVVWADIGLRPRAAVLDAGDRTVPLNSCYVVRCPTSDDAFALSALLNSSLVAAWLSVVAEPARGGYRRYLGWTMALLPIPEEWDRHRELLADLGRRGRADPASVGTMELLDAAMEAYGLRPRQVEPLLGWAAS